MLSPGPADAGHGERDASLARAAVRVSDRARSGAGSSPQVSPPLQLDHRRDQGRQVQVGSQALPHAPARIHTLRRINFDELYILGDDPKPFRIRYSAREVVYTGYELRRILLSFWRDLCLTSLLEDGSENNRLVLAIILFLEQQKLTEEFISLIRTNEGAPAVLPPRQSSSNVSLSRRNRKSSSTEEGSRMEVRSLQRRVSDVEAENTTPD